MELQGKEDRAIPTLQREMKECEKGIDNLVNAIQAGLFSESMRDRMNELEEQRKQLSEQIHELRMAQPVCTKEEAAQKIRSINSKGFSEHL